MLDNFRKVVSLFDKRTRIQFGLLFVMMFFGALLEMVGVGMFLPLLQLVATPDKIAANEFLLQFHNALGGDVMTSFAVGAALMVSFFVLKSVLIALFTYIQNKFVYHKMTRASTAQLRDYCSRDYSFHLQRNSAEFIRNIMTSVRVVFTSGIMASMNVLLEILLSLGALTALVFVDPVSTLIGVGILGLAMGIWYLLVRKAILRWSRDSQDSTRDMFLGINQAIGGLKEATVLGRTEFFNRSFFSAALVQADTIAKLSTVSQFPRLIGEVVVVAAALSIVAVIIVQTNQLVAAVPVVGVFAVAALRILPSMSRIFTGLSQIRQSGPAIHDLYFDFARPEEVMGGALRVETQEDTDPAISFNKNIHLQEVGYQYVGAKGSAVSGINISIKKGESVGLIGRSGAGKSTLADLILGLLAPTSGTIQVDGRDIHSNLRSWQSLIGYVPQEIFLCDGSIRSNIAFGLEDEDIDEERILTAVEQAYLSDVVQNMPDGLNTIVGERGVRLSGGQRQRIGIARALYHGPELIVFDEATSSLDSLAEKTIADTIDDLKREKTVIIIAHRLTSVKRCDRLYLIESGKNSGEGSLEELARDNATFREIANLQAPEDLPTVL